MNVVLSKKLKALSEDSVASLLERLNGDGVILPTLAGVIENLDSDEQQVLDAARGISGVLLDDLAHSTRARMWLIELLTTVLTDRVATGARGTNARIRLARKGWLDVADFNLSFSDEYRSIADRRISREDAMRTVREPFATFRLVLDGNENDLDSTWLFTRFLSDKLIHLLKATQVQSTLQISSSWMMPSTMLRGNAEHSPFDAFRQFAERYGAPFSINGGLPQRFAEHAVFRKRRYDSAAEIELIDSSIREVYLHSLRRVSPLGVVSLRMVYVVDLARYRSETNLPA